MKIILPFPFKNIEPIITNMPTITDEIPANLWDFCHTTSFAILHEVLRPMKEFLLNLGIILPNTIWKRPIITVINLRASTLRGLFV